MVNQAQWMLEGLLVLLLGTTLFHAYRLERSLGVLRRDRAALDTLLAGFNDSTRSAEESLERLRNCAEGAGRQLGRQMERAQALRDDLVFLTERSEKSADQLERSLREARPVRSEAPPRAVERVVAAAVPTPPERSEAAEPRVRSKAERDLIRALNLGR